MTVADEWEQMCGGSWEDEHAAKAAPTPAPSPAEQAVIDRFEAAEEPEEIRVERVAVAIFEQAHPIVEAFPDYWHRVTGGEDTRDRYRDMARAAIAALDPS